MDLSLIAAGSIDWSWWGNLAQGIGALGLVILIHEFGHFAAAKLCGVKVEKFYIGFDFFGLRFFRFRWGETEYGLGVFPLGGYVYMFGQTDNPAKQAEEAERAKQAAAEGKPYDAEAAAPWDPRSYPAQSVPERMFIISAGVIMNAVTAFLFAFWAYNRGAEFTPTNDISMVTPGGAAWTADLRMGDDIVEIEGVTQPRFKEDIAARSAVADLKRGLHFRIRRDGVDDFERTITPRKPRPGLPPMLGMTGARTTTLIPSRDNSKIKPTAEGTPARGAQPEFLPSDEFVRIEDREIHDYPDVVRAETFYADRPITVTVRRKVHGDAADADALKVDDPKTEVVKTEEVKIVVAPHPLRTLGMEMEFEPITAVQENSPAAKAGFRAGDKLKSIDGAPLGDPLTLAERLRRKQKAAPGQTWKIVVERTDEAGKAQDVTLDVVPREADYYEQPMLPGSPISAPTLGIAFGVSAKVAKVEPNGPADRAGVKAGDVFKQFKTLPTEELRDNGKPEPQQDISLTGDDEHNWALLAAALLQELNSATKIELTTADDRKLTLSPADSTEFFNPERGFRFDSPRFTRQAQNFSEAVNYAWIDTRDGMTQVYKFLHAMWIGQISPSNLGGMITIADQASHSASQGFSALLLFITMLSCNLAVLNFLPFPVLDGGHMVFLIYEGIFRRPPPQAIVNVLTLFGFVCLMLLMMYALGMDVVRLIR